MAPHLAVIIAAGTSIAFAAAARLELVSHAQPPAVCDAFGGGLIIGGLGWIDGSHGEESESAAVGRLANRTCAIAGFAVAAADSGKIIHLITAREGFLLLTEIATRHRECERVER